MELSSLQKRLADTCTGRRVLILGFGREGKSTLSILRKYGIDCRITIADMNPVDENLAKDCKIVVGQDYLKSINDNDVVFKSPGVVPDKPLTDYSAVITSQVEEFIASYKERIIGITGTKGKSTTSTLLYHVLECANYPAVLGGNIGIPVFDLDEKIKSDTLVVLELSCHQLEYAVSSPRYAILLNLYEDHLDHYKTLENYHNAKKNLYRKQLTDDILWCNPECLPKPGECKSDVIPVNTDKLPFKSFEELGDVSLKGNHNLLNASFVYELARKFNISDEIFIEAVKTYRTLPHRLEKIGCFNSVDYYDDSISTTVMSCINAVRSVYNASVLLIGGMERDIDYTELVRFLATSKLDMVICMYESGERIYHMIDATDSFKPGYIKVNDLKEAVKKAVQSVPEGGAVIMSPAAASYGYFKNFEERGDVFKQLVIEQCNTNT